MLFLSAILSLSLLEPGASISVAQEGGIAVPDELARAHAAVVGLVTPVVTSTEVEELSANLDTAVLSDQFIDVLWTFVQLKHLVSKTSLAGFDLDRLVDSYVDLLGETVEKGQIRQAINVNLELVYRSGALDVELDESQITLHRFRDEFTKLADEPRCAVGRCVVAALALSLLAERQDQVPPSVLARLFETWAHGYADLLAEVDPIQRQLNQTLFMFPAEIRDAVNRITYVAKPGADGDEEIVVYIILDDDADVAGLDVVQNHRVRTALGFTVSWVLEDEDPRTVSLRAQRASEPGPVEDLLRRGA